MKVKELIAILSIYGKDIEVVIDLEKFDGISDQNFVLNLEKATKYKDDIYIQSDGNIPVLVIKSTKQLLGYDGDDL